MLSARDSTWLGRDGAVGAGGEGEKDRDRQRETERKRGGEERVGVERQTDRQTENSNSKTRIVGLGPFGPNSQSLLKLSLIHI